MLRQLNAIVRIFAIVAALLGSSQFVSAQDVPTDGNTVTMEVPAQNIIAAVVDENWTTWEQDPFQMFAFVVLPNGEMNVSEAWSNLPQDLYASLVVPDGVETASIGNGLQFWTYGGISDVPQLGGLDSDDVFNACPELKSCFLDTLQGAQPGLVRVAPTSDNACPSWDFGDNSVLWEYYDGTSYKSGIRELSRASKYGWGNNCQPVWFFHYAEN